MSTRPPLKHLTPFSALKNLVRNQHLEMKMRSRIACPPPETALYKSTLCTYTGPSIGSVDNDYLTKYSPRPSVINVKIALETHSKRSFEGFWSAK